MLAGVDMHLIQIIIAAFFLLSIYEAFTSSVWKCRRADVAAIKLLLVGIVLSSSLTLCALFLWNYYGYRANIGPEFRVVTDLMTLSVGAVYHQLVWIIDRRKITRTEGTLHHANPTR